MSMSTGGGDPGSEVPKVDINVTPLADVMLVLLIIFMITAPLMSHKIKIELPNAPLKGAPAQVKAPPLDLAVQADGTVYLNDNAVTQAVLDARLRTAANQVPQPDVHIRADKTTPYKVIWKTMQDAKAAGIVHLGFITVGSEKKAEGALSP